MSALSHNNLISKQIHLRIQYSQLRKKFAKKSLLDWFVYILRMALQVQNNQREPTAP